MMGGLANLSHFQLDALTIMLLLQGLIVAAVPEEVVFLSLGTLWAHQKIGFVEAVLACQMGLIPANASMVFIGKKLGWRVLTKKPFSWLFKKRLLDTAIGFLHKLGGWAVVITRFTPLIRGPVYLGVGLSEMPLGRFIQLDSLASCVHIPILIYLGSLIGKRFGSVDEIYHGIVVVMGTCIFLCGCLLILDYLRQRRTEKAFVDGV